MKKKLINAFRANSFKYGTFSLIMSAIVIAVIIVINLLLTKLPSGMRNIDISDTQIYSVGDKTISILEELKDDITIYAISSGDANEGIRQILNKYQDLSKHISVEYIDINRKPAFLSNYELDGKTYDSGTDLLVESAKRYTYIDNDDIYEENSSRFDAEGEITSAISYVTTDELPKMYILSGHGEAELDSVVQDLLKHNNISTENLDLVAAGAVPEDCDVLLCYKPVGDFTQDEVDILENFISTGGNMILFNYTDAQAKMTNYSEFLNYYGVEIPVKQYIFEGNNKYVYPRRYYLYESAGSTNLTSGVTGNVFATFASPIMQVDGMRKTLTISSVLSSSSESWVRVDLESDKLDEKIDTDLDGPFDYAVDILDKTNAGLGELVIFSCYSFLELSTINKEVPTNVNGEVFMNVVSEMAELTTNVSISAKSTGFVMNTSTAQEYNISLVIFVLLVPVLVLITGLVIWICRRRR